MDITGLQPVILVWRPETSTLLSLQVNQRIAAQVLQVAGDQVLLTLEGVPIVARLTSSDQATTLAEQRTAHFLVKENLGASIRLQLLPVGAEVPQEATSKPLANLAPSLLTMVGLPTDKANTLIAEALLREGLPVTPELVNELRSALSRVSGWGQGQAQQAAVLKAEGQPVTPETLSLALTQSNSPPLADMVSNLKAKLEQLAKLPLPPKEAEQLQKAISLLVQLQVNWDTPQADLVENLHQALTTLGQPIERELAKFIQAQQQDQLPILNTRGGQVGFERELAKFMQETAKLLNTPEGQAKFIQDIARLLNTPEEQTQFIQQTARLLNTPAELAKFMQETAKLLNTPEGQAKFIQDIARLLNTPEEQTQFKQQTASLLNTPAEQAKFMQEIARVLNSPENQATFQRDLIKFIQGKLQFPPDIPQKQAAFEAELAQFVKDNTSLLSTPERLVVFERELARFVLSRAQLPQTAEGDKEKWMILARLPGELAGKAPESVAKDIEQLLDRVRWTQFRNVEPQTPPMRGNWLTLELPVIATAQGNVQSQPEIVQIRIAYQSKGGEKRKIDINNTHLVMHFELDEINSMDVDLAIIERKIGARVTVSNPVLQPMAEDELPALASGMEELGFILKTTYCETSLPVIQMAHGTAAGELTPTRNRLDGAGGVDLEV